MKRNKTMSFEDDVMDYLLKQDNASQYIEDLVRHDIERASKKKEGITEFSNINEIVVVDEAAKQKKEDERKARANAWASLDIEVQEAIKDIPSWGEFWKTTLYPLYLKNGNKLELIDIVRVNE